MVPCWEVGGGGALWSGGGPVGGVGGTGGEGRVTFLSCGEGLVKRTISNVSKPKKVRNRSLFGISLNDLHSGGLIEGSE